MLDILFYNFPYASLETKSLTGHGASWPPPALVIPQLAIAPHSSGDRGSCGHICFSMSAGVWAQISSLLSKCSCRDISLDPAILFMCLIFFKWVVIFVVFGHQKQQSSVTNMTAVYYIQWVVTEIVLCAHVKHSHCLQVIWFQRCWRTTFCFMPQ